MNAKPKKSEGYKYAIYCVIKSYFSEFNYCDLNDVIYFFTEYENCDEDDWVKTRAMLKAIKEIAHIDNVLDKGHFHTVSTLVDDYNRTLIDESEELQ